MDNLSQILRLQSELLTAAVKDSSRSIEHLSDYFTGPAFEKLDLDQHCQEYADVVQTFQFYDRLSQRIEVVAKVLEQVALNAEKNGEVVVVGEIDAEALIHKVESLFDSDTVAEIFSHHGFSEETKLLQQKSSAVKSSTRIELF